MRRYSLCLLLLGLLSPLALTIVSARAIPAARDFPFVTARVE